MPPQQSKAKKKECHARPPSSRSLPPSRVAQRRPRLRQSRRRRRARPRRSTRALHRTWRRPGIRALPLRRAGKIWSLQVSARNKSPHDNAHAAPKFRGSNRCAPALPATMHETEFATQSVPPALTAGLLNSDSLCRFLYAYADSTPMTHPDRPPKRPWGLDQSPGPTVRQSIPT